MNILGDVFMDYFNILRILQHVLNILLCVVLQQEDISLPREYFSCQLRRLWAVADCISQLYFSTVFLKCISQMYSGYEQWLTPPAAHLRFVGRVVDWNIFNPPTSSLMTHHTYIRAHVVVEVHIREYLDPQRLFNEARLARLSLRWSMKIFCHTRNNPSANEPSLRPNIEQGFSVYCNMYNI